MPQKEPGIRKIAALCETLCGQMGYTLYDAALEKEPAGRYLRVYIDTDREGGITLDDCERYHRAVQPLVEDYEYDFLEVCSPGADRPIRNERDAEKARGQMVDVKLYKPVNGVKQLTGALLEMDGDSVTVKTKEGDVTLERKSVAIIRLKPDLSALDE